VFRKFPEHKSEVVLFNLCCGTFGTAAATGLLYHPRKIDDGDCGEIGGNEVWQGKPKYSEKTCPSAVSQSVRQQFIAPMS
jgi:hypothetical protein